MVVSNHAAVGEDSPLVRVERNGLVAEVVFQRPDKLNALNRELLTQFSGHLRALADDDSVACVILRGEGRAFSVGFDIAQEQDDNAYEDWKLLRNHLERWMQVWDLPKPVIAAVHGYCLGGATMLSACADITVIAVDAVVGWPSMPLGGGLLSPVSMWLIGPKKAKELSFIARSSFSGLEAQQLGWANAAVPEDEVLNTARSLAASIVRTPLPLLRIKKLALNRIMDMQGFRESVYYGAEWDAIAHTTRENQANVELIRQLGVKKAIARFHGED